MKKLSCLSQAACLATLFAGLATPAHAASFLLQRLAQNPEYAPGSDVPVRLYGTVDLGVNVRKVDGVDSKVGLQSGGEWSSKLGLYGREDLGDGLRAEFNLESGFQADTGTQSTSSALWDRAAWVGLKSSDWGSVRLGRQIGATLPLFIDVFGLVSTNSVFSWAGTSVVQTAKGAGYNADLGAGASQVELRVPGSLTYTTPRVLGLDAKFIYAPATSSTAVHDVYNQGGVLTWTNGRWFLASSFNQVWAKPLLAASTTAETRTDLYGIGGVYDDGELVLSAAYTRSTPDVANAATANVYALGAILPRGAHTWRLSSVYRKVDDLKNNAGVPQHSAALGLMAGYDYELSLRTGLYARAGIVRNFGVSTVMLNSSALPLQAGSYSPQLGIASRTVSVGMFHHF